MIEIKELSFKYSDNNGFAIQDVNLSITKGEFLTIIGENGSGKSTLLKLVANLLNPDSGEIRIDGKNIQEYKGTELSKIIAFVPQNTNSIFPFTVFEIVMMGRSPYLNYLGLNDKNDVEQVNKALKRVGIYNLRNKGINEISGGESQRAFIARAIVQQTDIILLDEPSAHLDIHHQIEIHKLLKELNEAGKTIITVSHNLNLTASFSERVILMKNGKIELDDKVSKVLTEANIEKYFKVNSAVIESGNKINILIKP